MKSAMATKSQPCPRPWRLIWETALGTGFPNSGSQIGKAHETIPVKGSRLCRKPEYLH